MPTTTRGSELPVVTVVHAPACHFCDDAQQALAAFATQFAFSVELVDAEEPGGAALMATHGAPMFPLILIDGAFFSSGRLPRKKLHKLLEARATLVA